MDTTDLISLLQILVVRSDGYLRPTAKVPWLLASNVLPVAATVIGWGGPLNLLGASGLDTFCVVAAGTLALLSEVLACQECS